MASEYLTGWQYGSASSLVGDFMRYIDDHDIPPVITYSDIGAYELRARGKYANRFYVMGEMSDIHRERFNAHQGYYLVIEIPRLNQTGGYVDYFATCLVEYQATSKGITGRLYDCRQAPPL